MEKEVIKGKEAGREEEGRGSGERGRRQKEEEGEEGKEGSKE